jgi:hypothetical protein
MANFFQEYKPFRNFLQQFELTESLANVWRFSLLVMDKVQLPPRYIQGTPFGLNPASVLHAWELDILSREFVLNAGKTGQRSLRRWNDLANTVNHLRRLDGAAFMAANNGNPDVLFELHRIAHRQFPYTDTGILPLMRAAKVFGEAAIDQIAQRELGLSAKEFFRLGVAVSGHFNRTFGLSTNQDYSVIRIPASATQAFFARMTIPFTELKAQLKQLQRYDQDWCFTWNPLEAKPLVMLDPAHPDRVFCPIPRFLLRRAFGGLFYDLVKASDFDNSFGRAFQSYVGEILSRTCPPPRFKLGAVEPYIVGGQTFHGTDWILSDGSGHIFVEAKTKRLTVNARVSSDTSALEKDLTVLAEAIAQNYRNIEDAAAGKTNWVNDGLPIYPLVLTMEDWYILSPRVKQMLDDKVLAELGALRISEKVMTDMPWQLGSAHELEIASQLIAQVGVKSVMDAETPEQRGWSLLPALRDRFSEEFAKINYHLFTDDFLALVPEAQPGAKPPSGI